MNFISLNKQEAACGRLSSTSLLIKFNAKIRDEIRNGYDVTGLNVIRIAYELSYQSKRSTNRAT